MIHSVIFDTAPVSGTGIFYDHNLTIYGLPWDGTPQAAWRLFSNYTELPIYSMAFETITSTQSKIRNFAASPVIFTAHHNVFDHSIEYRSDPFGGLHPLGTRTQEIYPILPGGATPVATAHQLGYKPDVVIIWGDTVLSPGSITVDMDATDDQVVWMASGPGAENPDVTLMKFHSIQSGPDYVAKSKVGNISTIAPYPTQVTVNHGFGFKPDWVFVNGGETDFRYVRWAPDQIVTDTTCVLYVDQDPGGDILCDLIGIKHHSIFNTSQLPL